MFFHIVKKDETVSDIAALYRISSAKIIEDNGLVSPYRLIPGSVLILPHRLRLHTVRGGENAEEIAQRYQLSEGLLSRLNPALAANGATYPGQILTVESPSLSPVSVMGMTDARTSVTKVRAALPYLTYLTIVGGSPSQTERLCSEAKKAGVIPLCQASDSPGSMGQVGEKRKKEDGLFFSYDLSSSADGYLMNFDIIEEGGNKNFACFPFGYTENGIPHQSPIPPLIWKRLLREGGEIHRESKQSYFDLPIRMGGRITPNRYTFIDAIQEKTLLEEKYKQGSCGFWIPQTEEWSTERRLLFSLFFEPIKAWKECRTTVWHSVP